MAKSAQAFRTIREVADWLGVAAHVLRFWESKFSQIKPVKRAGGRRYYRPTDMQIVGGIKVLLHDRGLTIRGVQKMISEDGIDAVTALSPPLDDTGPATDMPDEDNVVDLRPEEDWADDAAAEAEAGSEVETPAAPEPEPEPPAPVSAPTDVAAPAPAPADPVPEPSASPEPTMDADPEAPASDTPEVEAPVAPPSPEPVPETLDTTPPAAGTESPEPEPEPEPPLDVAPVPEPEPAPEHDATETGDAAPQGQPDEAPEPQPIAADTAIPLPASDPVEGRFGPIAALPGTLADLSADQRAALPAHVAALRALAARMATPPDPS